MIEFKQVSKRYGSKKALKDISFTLPAGKIIGVIGENGSGKSTTLKLIAGLAKPTSGTITIDGQPVTRRSCRYVSYLSDSDQFYPFFTIGDMIDFYQSQFADFQVEKANEILTFMKLDRTQKINSLSKGNRGRLKITLSLARDVPIILMDEPLAGLDPMVRDSIIRGLISYIDIEKQTVLITTHEVEEVEPILDTMMAIRDGELLCIQDVEELREQEKTGILEWMKRVYQ
ncbi:spermidine/putrescine ABC transporter ATP-binding protein [Ammoniphilus oxalaticus]|uniref:Spermidine/putrescine ABC transporter ATP-binding protein n=1 Tax=Ammoniphilus oxalaticus TaxID=66863 RepID=A0A419SGF4_9BACL|nr:ABC transporter ATP-binding protein [Ammoniphilus oxalaticus]RKD22859.1 spermidine/putrescine ABC transporter ATP-binding protein [Ammoniphilus oxalaticus]